MTTVEAEIASLQRVLERVQSARNEDLPGVLEALLPKLVALTNQDALRMKAMELVKECMKRLKLSKCPLNITKLLACVGPSMMPFAANFAITFIDVAIEFNVHSPTTDHGDIASSLLLGLGSFEAFTAQSNALCYYALVLYHTVLSEQFNSVRTDDNKQQLHNAQSVLGDFGLDLALLQRPLQITSSDSGAVGSVYPGLSPGRVERITSRKKQWTPEQLKSIKLSLITMIASGVFLPHHAVLIAVTLANDADAEVSAQATFKMNGVANMLGIDQSAEIAKTVCEAVLSTCSPAAENMSGAAAAVHKRSTLRPEVRLPALRWLTKYVPSHLTACAKRIIMLLFNSVFGSATGAAGTSVAGLLNEEVAVVAASCQLLEALLLHVDDASLTPLVLLILLCVKKILQSFAFSTTSFNVGEHHMEVRSACYRIIEVIAAKYATAAKLEEARRIDQAAMIDESTEVGAEGQGAGALVAPAVPEPQSALVAQLSKATVQDAELLMLLFQLLDREHEQRTESSILAIYRAMNALREAYIYTRESSEGAYAAASTAVSFHIMLLTPHPRSPFHQIIPAVGRSTLREARWAH
jgi:hypothetical protein